MDNEGVVPINNTVFDPKMVNHSIDLYFFPGSPPCRAALLLIKALGLRCNIKNINLLNGDHLTPEFLKLNPMHTLPTMDDNGFILWDSHAIMKYLVDQYAKDDSLYPRDPKKGAMVTQRLFFDASTLTPRFVDYCAPVLFAGQQPDPSKAAKYEEALGYLDGFLANQNFVAGPSLTIADFSIIANISTAEVVMINLSKYSNIFAWYERTKEAMSGFAYQEVNQQGADAFGAMFRSKIK